MVIGTFVRISFNNHYKIAEVVDAFDKKSEYELGKSKTSL
jgi:hypothetical protein